jgi:hypothetical protein
MDVKVVKEEGYEEALLGLGLSFYKESEDLDLWWDDKKLDKMRKVAKKLSQKGPSHSKFIRLCNLTILIKAPRFFWSEFDTYKIGTTGLSASTMHTLLKEPLTQQHFEYPLLGTYLDYLNRLIKEGNFKIESMKNALPEGYLQTRLILMNYQTLRTIIAQRQNHRLPQWRMFIKKMKEQVKYKELLEGVNYE